MTIPFSGSLAFRCAMSLVAVASFVHTEAVSAQEEESAVVHVRVTGSIGAGALRHIERALADARSAGAAAVVIDLDAQGGSVAAAQLAVGSIVESPVPVYAYVNPTAWGLGALIALAADSVFMGVGSSLGWGKVTEEEAGFSPRALRELRSEFRVLAVRRGLDDQVAIAMVDPDIAIEGLVEPGERLTLSPGEANRLGYAVGEVGDADQLLNAVGLGDENLGTYAPPPAVRGIVITVANNNWRDVRISLIYGTSGSIRRNLGHVTSMNTAEYEIPQQAVTAGTRIQVVAEVIGSAERTATDFITAQPGLAIDWVIANVISQSNYFAYIRY